MTQKLHLMQGVTASVPMHQPSAKGASQPQNPTLEAETF